MKNNFRMLCAAAILSLAICAFGSDSPETGGYGPAQDAADAIRTFASADGAFIAAGQIRMSSNKTDLSKLLKYPTEGVVVLNLTGAQIKQAFEHSVSLFPQPNQSFLQVSGFDISFNATAQPNARIISISVGGAKLDESKTYSVAMPSSLARGSLGFFRIWDKIKPAKTFPGTIEDALRGKPSTGSASRWSAQ